MPAPNPSERFHKPDLLSIAMHKEPDFLHNLRQELKDGRRWLDRSIVLAHAAAAGLCVVVFTLLADAAFGVFQRIYHWQGG